MTHVDALERTLTHGGLATKDEYAALVELCRTLARQMDDAGAEASTRLTAAYLSALKDVSRVARGAKPTGRKGALASVSNIPRPAGGAS